MKNEVQAMLALAEEKLRAAGLLLEGGAWADAASRTSSPGASHKSFRKDR